MSCSLSQAEKSLILDSWKALQKDCQGHGIRFFLMLFMNHPEVQEKFFPMMSANDIQLLGRHGATVLEEVGNVAQSFCNDENEKLQERIMTLAKNHHKRKVGVHHFQIACKVLIEYMESNLGSDFSPEAGMAWKKLLDTMVKKVGEEMRKM